MRVLAHESLRSRIEGVGLRFLPRERLPNLYLRDDFADSADPWWDDVFFSPVSGDDVAGALDREPADVVIVDCLLWGDSAASEAKGRPTVIFVHSLYGRFVGDVSGEGLLDRIDTLNDARSRWGLAPIAEPRQAWETSPCVLVASASVLDVPDLPPNVLHVGPLRDDDSMSRPVSVPAGRPLVLISFSTSKTVTPRLTQRVLDVLAELPVTGLLTTGEYLDRATLTIPPNVGVEAFVPHPTVMPHADVAITHAGHGTVMAALSAGVPLLCLPLVADQPFVAQRVEEIGAGISLPPPAGAEAIRAALVELLTSPSYRSSAAMCGEAIRAELDLDAAARAVTDAASEWLAA